jgi:endonuclease YncB( thermonuclease family)
LRVNLTVRLLGVNAPEMKTAAGRTAKAWVTAWLADHAPDGKVVLKTTKDRHEKYGRYLGTVYGHDLRNLNGDLLAAGQAVPYMV